MRGRDGCRERWRGGDNRAHACQHGDPSPAASPLLPPLPPLLSSLTLIEFRPCLDTSVFLDELTTTRERRELGRRGEEGKKTGEGRKKKRGPGRAPPFAGPAACRCLGPSSDARSWPRARTPRWAGCGLWGGRREGGARRGAPTQPRLATKRGGGWQRARRACRPCPTQQRAACQRVVQESVWRGRRANRRGGGKANSQLKGIGEKDGVWGASAAKYSPDSRRLGSEGQGRHCGGCGGSGGGGGRREKRSKRREVWAKGSVSFFAFAAQSKSVFYFARVSPRPRALSSMHQQLVLDLERLVGGFVRINLWKKVRPFFSRVGAGARFGRGVGPLLSVSPVCRHARHHAPPIACTLPLAALLRRRQRAQAAVGTTRLRTSHRGRRRPGHAFWIRGRPQFARPPRPLETLYSAACEGRGAVDDAEGERARQTRQLHRTTCRAV